MDVWAHDLTTGMWHACRVLKSFENHYEGHTSIISLENESIEATFLHPFWVVQGQDLDLRPRREHLTPVSKIATTQGRWVDACDLLVGDRLLLRDGRIAFIDGIRHQPYCGTVYNILVEDLHTYGVGKCGALAHNGNAEEAGADMLLAARLRTQVNNLRALRNLALDQHQTNRAAQLAQQIQSLMQQIDQLFDIFD